MDGDEDFYEMFREIMEQLDDEDPAGRMRMLSKNPRYGAEDPETTLKSKHKER